MPSGAGLLLTEAGLLAAVGLLFEWAHPSPGGRQQLAAQHMWLLLQQARSEEQARSEGGGLRVRCVGEVSGWPGWASAAADQGLHACAASSGPRAASQGPDCLPALRANRCDCGLLQCFWACNCLSWGLWLDHLCVAQSATAAHSACTSNARSCRWHGGQKGTSNDETAGCAWEPSVGQYG